MSDKSTRFGFKAVPPPVAFGGFGGKSQNTSNKEPLKTANNYFASARQKNEKLRNYFDDDDDEFPTSSSGAPANTAADDGDYDPLDAFMAGVQEQVQKEEQTVGTNEPPPEIVSGQDGQDYDSYLADLDKQANVDDEANYDSDGLPVTEGSKKDGEKSRIEPLPIVDHSTMIYKPFKKNFYRENIELSRMSLDDVAILREELEVSVLGSDTPKPIQSFEMSCLPPVLLKEISKIGFEKPTSIQAQALPIAMSGRDLIGLAKTGSGKTLAYVWPMIVHVLDQPQMQIGDGPIGIVLSPTRELAAQIYAEAKKFSKCFSIRVCAVFGGGGKWEMVKALKEAPEMVVATPGRFIELIRSKATNLHRCTMVVLDEADRMFEMGFEYQMRSIVNNVRPDRQTLLFSATMKRKVEGFARELLNNPIRIVLGTIGQANPDIKQVVEMVSSEEAKWTWLSQSVDEYVADGKVLIFVLSKSGVEELTLALRRHFTARQLDVGVESLHGDKDQAERTISMRKFSKSQETAILVATDIASRGLDVKDIRTVINYDVAKNIETYVHRIGRTGRMGLDGVVPGTAYTLITPADGSFAVDLVQNLNLSSQKVASALQDLAEKDPKWGRIRHITAGGGRGAAPHGQVSGFGGAAGRGGAGGGGGIGFAIGGRPAAKAMTSSMLAGSSSGKKGGGITMTFSKAMGGKSSAGGGGSGGGGGSLGGDGGVIARGGVIPGNTAANPYIEGQGMGRGKHLTKPSWSDGSDVPSERGSNFTPSASSSSSVNHSAQFDDAAPSIVPSIDVIEKKRNRFSAEAPQPPVSHMPHMPPSAPAAPAMSGFIRATVTAASFSVTEKKNSGELYSSAVINESISDSLPKKSRWDK